MKKESMVNEELRVKLEAAEEELQEVRSSLEKQVQIRTTQLEVAKREWESTFDAIDEPVLLLDPSYNILRANLALARTVGHNIRQLVGRKCYQMLMSRDAPCLGCPLEDTIAQKESKAVEVCHAEDSTTYQMRSFLLSKDPPKAVHTYHDITEEYEIRQKLIQSEKLSSIGLLAGRVAHEINNPLAGILAQTQLLLMDATPGDDSYPSLKDIEKAALRCRKIVQDLLNFSRQTPTERKQRYDINELVHQSIKFYEMLAPIGQTELILELGSELPLLRMDTTKMQSVLLNLLGNAKAAIPTPKNIWLRTFQEGQEIRIEIQDDGGGIPLHLQEKVFDPFFTTKAPGLGTGLGLYIVKEIIREHEGQISLLSSDKQGATFQIRLPLESRKKANQT